MFLINVFLSKSIVGERRTKVWTKKKAVNVILLVEPTVATVPQQIESGADKH